MGFDAAVGNGNQGTTPCLCLQVLASPSLVLLPLQDEDGDWVMVTPDEPWSSVAAAATKVLVTNRT